MAMIALYEKAGMDRNYDTTRREIIKERHSQCTSGEQGQEMGIRRRTCMRWRRIEREGNDQKERHERMYSEGIDRAKRAGTTEKQHISYRDQSTQAITRTSRTPMMHDTAEDYQSDMAQNRD